MYKDRTLRYKNNIYENAQPVINVYIDDELINTKHIYGLKFGGELFSDELALGSTPSQYIELKIKNGIVSNPSKVKIDFGLYFGGMLTVQEVSDMLVSELDSTIIDKLYSDIDYIPMGEYNVDSYKDENDNITVIKALDNMIKFDANDGYYDASQIISEKGYVTLIEVAQDICNKKGVELRIYFFFK